MAAGLAGCASAPALQADPVPEQSSSEQPPAAEAISGDWAWHSQLAISHEPNQAVAPWKNHTFPGKSPTLFSAAHQDGRIAMEAFSDSAASMLRSDVQIAPEALGALQFSWKVPQLIGGADMARRDSDDSAVRVVLAFDGDRSRFSPRDAVMSELARAVTGEDMPYATLMYVWCNVRPPGTVIVNPRTDRIRKLVVESGPARLGRWLDYERDVRADFQRAFGEPPGALIGVGIMTDTDNTRTTARAWYGPVRMVATTARIR